MKKLLLVLLMAISVNGFGKDLILFKNGENKTYPHKGKIVTYHKNGQKKLEMSYKNGRPEEEWISYYENGEVKATGNYKNGKPDGEYICYDENGIVKTKIEYIEGLKKEEYIYNDTHRHTDNCECLRNSQLNIEETTG